MSPWLGSETSLFITNVVEQSELSPSQILPPILFSNTFSSRTPITDSQFRYHSASNLVVSLRQIASRSRTTNDNKSSREEMVNESCVIDSCKPKLKSPFTRSKAGSNKPTLSETASSRLQCLSTELIEKIASYLVCKCPFSIPRYHVSPRHKPKRLPGSAGAENNCEHASCQN